MIQKVRISIVSIHRQDSADPAEDSRQGDRIELRAEGTGVKTGEGWQVRYRDEKQGTDCLLKLSPEAVLWRSSGATLARMQFGKDRRYPGSYQIAGGGFALETVTEHWQYLETAKGASGSLRYRLEAQGECLSLCEMCIRLETMEEGNET